MIKTDLLIALFLISFAVSGVAQIVTLDKGHYRSVYNLEIQCPQQVWWTVARSQLGNVKREPSWRFVQDIGQSLANGSHDDYNQSGYDRGHLCPAQDRSADLRMMRSTFALSNIAPMAPALNRGAWKKTEAFCRAQALFHDSVQVLALPIFLDRDTCFIGSHRLAVPHAFIKAAWLKENDSVIGVWFYWNR